jgi:hypothetical protein
MSQADLMTVSLEATPQNGVLAVSRRLVGQPAIRVLKEPGRLSQMLGCKPTSDDLVFRDEVEADNPAIEVRIGVNTDLYAMVSATAKSMRQPPLPFPECLEFTIQPKQGKLVLSWVARNQWGYIPFGMAYVVRLDRVRAFFQEVMHSDKDSSAHNLCPEDPEMDIFVRWYPQWAAQLGQYVGGK